MTERTQEELLQELINRFGTNPLNWAFQCPSCKTISTGADFRKALDESGKQHLHASDYLGRECIGRVSGILLRGNKNYSGPGCDWAAYGLFQGPDFIITPDGKRLPAFPIAPASGVEEDNERESVAEGTNTR